MTTQIQKTYWQRPEGKVGKTVLAATAIGAGVVGWFYLVPLIITLLANTLIAGALAVALVTSFIVVTNKDFQSLVSFLFKRGIYKATDTFYRIDPIGVLRVSISNLAERVKRMADIREQLGLQIQVNRRTIQANEVERRKNAEGAQSAADKYDYYLKSRQAGRMEESNTTRKDMLTKMEHMYKVLELYSNVTNTLVIDLTAEADTREKDRRDMLRSLSVFKAAAKELKGHEQAIEMFNRGVAILVEEQQSVFSEIANFEEMITEAVTKIDMESGIFDKNAIDQFDVWEKKADSLLLGPGKRNILSQALDATPKSYANSPQSKRSTYADLFGDDKK